LGCSLMPKREVLERRLYFLWKNRLLATKRAGQEGNCPIWQGKKIGREGVRSSARKRWCSSCFLENAGWNHCSHRKEGEVDKSRGGKRRTRSSFQKMQLQFQRGNVVKPSSSSQREGLGLPRTRVTSAGKDFLSLTPTSGAVVLRGGPDELSPQKGNYTGERGASPNRIEIWKRPKNPRPHSRRKRELNTKRKRRSSQHFQDEGVKKEGRPRWQKRKDGGKKNVCDKKKKKSTGPTLECVQKTRILPALRKTSNHERKENGGPKRKSRSTPKKRKQRNRRERSTRMPEERKDFTPVPEKKK